MILMMRRQKFNRNSLENAKWNNQWVVDLIQTELYADINLKKHQDSTCKFFCNQRPLVQKKTLTITCTCINSFEDMILIIRFISGVFE